MTMEVQRCWVQVHPTGLAQPNDFVHGRNSCVDQPCVTGDRFVAGFAHQVIAEAGAEVEAFTAF